MDVCAPSPTMSVGETSAAKALEDCVFKIVAKLEAIIDLTKTLNLPKDLAEKFQAAGGGGVGTGGGGSGSGGGGDGGGGSSNSSATMAPRKRKKSEINSGEVMLDQINELVALLAHLRGIEGADQVIPVPLGIVSAIDAGQDPNAFVADQLNSLLDRENVLRSRDNRFQEYETTLRDRLKQIDDRAATVKVPRRTAETPVAAAAPSSPM